MRLKGTLKCLVLASFVFVSSCATFSNMAAIFSPSEATKFFNKNGKAIWELRGWILGPENGQHLPSRPFEESEVKEARAYAKGVADSCVGTIVNDEETIGALRKIHTDRRNFYFANARRHSSDKREFLDPITPKNTCAVVLDFEAELFRRAYQYRDAVFARFHKEAKQEFENCKTRVTGEETTGSCDWKPFIHPEMTAVKSWKEEVDKLISLTLDPLDDSYFEGMLKELKGWKKTLFELAKPIRLQRDKLRYGHITRVLKRALSNSDDYVAQVLRAVGRTKLKKVICPSWTYQRNRIGIVLKRRVQCTMVVKLPNEPQCRTLEFAYLEDKVGRKFIKDDVIYLKEFHNSKISKCR